MDSVSMASIPVYLHYAVTRSDLVKFSIYIPASVLVHMLFTDGGGGLSCCYFVCVQLTRDLLAIAKFLV